MKKLLILLCCTAMLSPLAGCQNQQVGTTPTTSTTTEETITAKRPDKEYEMQPSEPVKFNPENSIFTFSEEEIKTYESFSQSFDKKLLVGLDPKSIFKLYIQYGIDGAWEAEFELYDQATIPPTYTKQDQFNAYMQEKDSQKNVEDYAKEVEDVEVLTAKKLAEMYFKDFDKGTFEASGDHGVLVFKTPEGNDFPPEEVTFKVTKSTDGYWQPIFHPFD